MMGFVFVYDDFPAKGPEYPVQQAQKDQDQEIEGVYFFDIAPDLVKSDGIDDNSKND